MELSGYVSPSSFLEDFVAITASTAIFAKRSDSADPRIFELSEVFAAFTRASRPSLSIGVACNVIEAVEFSAQPRPCGSEKQGRKSSYIVRFLHTKVDLMYLQASRIASLYPAMTVVGWILDRTSSFALLSSSAARITTDVVPFHTQAYATKRLSNRG